jgi:PhzF family phenazine biosynthesis protein
MTIEMYQVDAFTDKPFGGNPAAVCILNEPASDQWMQQLAQEMNLSETAYLLRQADGYSLRWFTPAVEVDLCGHATLASAHILWQTGLLPSDEEVHFHTKSGLLTANRQDDWIELNFPEEPEEPATPPDSLIEALGVAPKYVGRNRFAFLLQLASEDEVRQVQPDFGLLLKSTSLGAMVTSRADSSQYDFVSRFFAPGAGIDEDPVTGSAHCCLGPFWAGRLGKMEMVGFQASARGGVVGVRLDGDRVYLKGQAVTVLRGTLL